MSGLDRRAFLTRSGALLPGAAGAAGLVDTAARASGPPLPSDNPDTTAGGALAGSDLATPPPFTGVHQSGILNPAPAHATLVALDCFAPDRAMLAAGVQALSARAQQLALGGPIPLLEIDAPPADSGILGPDNAPDGLTVTIGFGASLFDGRYGLGSKRPAELIEMPTFPVDQLDPTSPTATSWCRSAPSTATPSCTPSGSWRAASAARSSSGGAWTASRAPTAAPRTRTARATCSRSATAPATPSPRTPRS